MHYPSDEKKPVKLFVLRDLRILREDAAREKMVRLSCVGYFCCASRFSRKNYSTLGLGKGVESFGFVRRDRFEWEQNESTPRRVLVYYAGYLYAVRVHECIVYLYCSAESACGIADVLKMIYLYADPTSAGRGKEAFAPRRAPQAVTGYRRGFSF